MPSEYQKEAIRQLAAAIIGQGFRAFIAERGTYGFYTDAEGTRVICFQYGLGGITFSGNYKTSSPRSTGTGWALTPDTFAGMFNQCAPAWAVRDAKWKYTTLAQHLAAYQKSSRYVEQSPEDLEVK